MKIFLLILSLNSLLCFGQSGVEVFILDCTNMVSKEDKKECTDEIILREVSAKWESINQKVKDGVYFIEYTVYSNGKVKTNSIKRVPDLVDSSNEMEVLEDLVDQILKKHKWQTPVKVEGVITGASQYLKINTAQL